MSIYHLAQANIARMAAPMTDPMMQEFVTQLEHVNALADKAPGFVWRLVEPANDPTVARVFKDDRLLFNMSVWESAHALYDFTYKTDHRAVLKDRRKWFDPMEGAHLVLWWIEPGRIPTIEEAKAKFDLLNSHGPGPHAFTFKQAAMLPD